MFWVLGGTISYSISNNSLTQKKKKNHLTLKKRKRQKKMNFRHKLIENLIKFSLSFDFKNIYIELINTISHDNFPII